jgi:hypothetical protein
MCGTWRLQTIQDAPAENVPILRMIALGMGVLTIERDDTRMDGSRIAW